MTVETLWVLVQIIVGVPLLWLLVNMVVLPWGIIRLLFVPYRKCSKWEKILLPGIYFSSDTEED